MLHNRCCSTSSGLSGKHHYLNTVTRWTTCHPIAVKIDAGGNSHLPTVHRPLPCLRNLSLVFTSIMCLSLFSKLCEHFFFCFVFVFLGCQTAEVFPGVPPHFMRNLCGCLPFCLPRREAGLTFHEVISGYCFCYSYALLLLHNTYSWPEQSDEKECGSATHPREKPFRRFKIDKVTKTRRVRVHFKPFNKFKHSKSVFQKNTLSSF